MDRLMSTRRGASTISYSTDGVRVRRVLFSLGGTERDGPNLEKFAETRDTHDE